MYDIIIIGMGISGITAGIYAKRSNKKVLIIDKGMPGGLLNSIDMISNYPGLIDIKGPDFAQILLEQAKSMDIPFVLEEVIKLDLSSDELIVTTTNQEYKAKKIILAMGRKPKVPGDSIRDALKKATTEMMTLCLLQERPMYTYELMQLFEERSQGAITFSTLYQTIYRLQAGEYIQEFRKTMSEDNRVRIYFAVTDEGRDYLTCLIQEYRLFTDAVDKIVGLNREGGGQCLQTAG